MHAVVLYVYAASATHDQLHLVLYRLQCMQGERCASLHTSCLRRGLLESDDEWHRCMEEASLYRLPPQLRALFATLLCMNTPAEPERLWLDFRDHMCQDFVLQARRVRESLAIIGALNLASCCFASAGNGLPLDTDWAKCCGCIENGVYACILTAVCMLTGRGRS